MSAERLNWLPPELYPIAMRVTRADECAYAIDELAARWLFDGPLDLLQTRHGDRVTVRVRAIRPIQPRISLLFSEAVNHLRAALDNVIWHLVEQAQGLVTGPTAALVAIPIYDDSRSSTSGNAVGSRLDWSRSWSASTAIASTRPDSFVSFGRETSATPDLRVRMARE